MRWKDELMFAYCEVTDFACYVPHKRSCGTLARAQHTAEHLAGRGSDGNIHLGHKYKEQLHIRKAPRFLCYGLFIVMLHACCCDLPSDEELRQDIVGTWVIESCDYPYSIEDDGVTTEHPLVGRGELTFYSDGSYSENGVISYCTVDSCDADTGLVNYCTCSFQIQDGGLTLVPDAIGIWGWLNFPFPIECLDDDRLVFDNVLFNTQVRKKACYRRK